LATAGTSSTSPELADIAYGVVAAIGATLVVGAFMLRRYRTKRFASMPAQDKGEQSVI
jgi:preprotein translocase subunit SecD